MTVWNWVMDEILVQRAAFGLMHVYVSVEND